MLSIKNKKIIIVCLLISIVNNSSAQSLDDWIESQIKSKVDEYITGYIDDKTDGLYSKVRSFYFNPIGTIWESYKNASIRNTVNSKASELKDFKVSEQELLRLRRKYNIGEKMPVDFKTVYMPIRYGIIETFHGSMAMLNTPLGKLANGEIYSLSSEYVDSLKSINDISDIETVLNQRALDSLALFSGFNIKETLLKDINANNKLLGLINRHPEVIRVYANSISTELRLRTEHLYYWSILADSYKEKLSRKVKLINPRMIKFETMDDTIALKYGNETIGFYSTYQNMYHYVTPDILYMMPQPNSSYQYKNTSVIIDKMGRLSSVRVRVNTSDKKIDKGKTKQKDIMKALGCSSKKDLYSQLLKKIKEQPSTAFFVQTGDQLDASRVSQIRKKIKGLLKESINSEVEITLNYNSGLYAPYSIDVIYGDSINKADCIRAGIDTPVSYEKKLYDLLTATKSVKNVFNGFIDEKYPVIMTLKILGENVEGNYYNPKFGNKNRMILKGKVSNNNLSIYEYDEKGIKYGCFEGTISNKVFSGQFVKDGKTQTFSVVGN